MEKERKTKRYKKKEIKDLKLGWIRDRKRNERLKDRKKREDKESREEVTETEKGFMREREWGKERYIYGMGMGYDIGRKRGTFIRYTRVEIYSMF